MGDVIVFYTDGITEAMNADSDLFGEARLSRIIEEHGHLDSAELRERILREIESFVGGADQHDDMTMILLKVEEALRALALVLAGQPLMGDLTVVFRTPSPIEADVVRGLLESHGIPAMISADLSRTPFPLSVNELRVTVNEENADQAEQLIESHRDDSRAGKRRAVRERARTARANDRLPVPRPRTARARADASLARARRRERRRLRQRVDGVSRRLDPRLRDRRHAVPAVPAAQRRAEVEAEASIVSATSLARLGERINLGDFLILGRGEEKTGGRRKHAIIADCYEALIAAIYLDGGFEPVRAFIRRQFQDLIDEARRSGASAFTEDYKSALQELLQRRAGPPRVPPGRRDRSRPPPPLRGRNPGRRRAARQGRRARARRMRPRMRRRARWTMLNAEVEWLNH